MKKLIVLLMLALTALTAYAQDGLIYGQTVAGVITDETPEVYYTFQGTQGDTLAIEMRSTDGGGLDSYLRLLTPDGLDYAIDDDSAGNLNALIAPVFLPQDGTYTIIASRCCNGAGTSTGSYELSITEVVVPPVALDQTFTFDLSADQTATYFLLNSNVVNGNVVSVQANRVGGTQQFQLEARGPVGERFYGVPQSQDGSFVVIRPLILLPDGVYLFTLRRISNYGEVEENQPLTIEAYLSGLVVTPITLGDTFSGTLNDSNPFALYSFETQTGDLLRLAGFGSDGGAFEASLYNTYGYIFNSANTFYTPNGTFAVDPIRVDDSGVHYLAVQRISQDVNGVLGQVSNYQISLGLSESPTLELGVAAEGSFDGSSVFDRTYRFTGEAGQAIRITLQSMSETYGPGVDVSIPAGESQPTRSLMSIYSSQPSTVTYDVTLPVSGVYIFRVYNSYYSEGAPLGGSYSLLVEPAQ